MVNKLVIRSCTARHRQSRGIEKLVFGSTGQKTKIGIQHGYEHKDIELLIRRKMRC